MAIKSSFGNMVFTLLWVTLAAGVGLGFVYEITKEPIREASLARQRQAIEAVMPGYDNDPVAEKMKVPAQGTSDSLEFYPARKGGELIGTAVKVRSRKGYSGDIWLMVGISVDGVIKSISVIEHQETPGLGSKMSDPDFLGQYIGRNPSKENINVKKDGGTIDAISGATISSRAFSEAVSIAHQTFLQSPYGRK